MLSEILENPIGDFQLPSIGLGLPNIGFGNALEGLGAGYT